MSETKAAVTNSATITVGVGLLGAVGFIVTADARVINPLLHIIATEFHTDIGSTGFIVTAYTIPYGLFQLVYGPLGDRIGKLRVILGTMAFFAVGTAACAAAPNLLVLNLLRFLTGVTAAAMIPMSLAYIGDNFAYEVRQAAIAQFLTAIALGNILSTSLGGLVADFLSWRMIFLIYGLLSLGVFGLLWRAGAQAKPESVRTTGSFSLLASLKPYGQLLLNPAPRLIIIAAFIEGVFFFGGFAYLGAFLRDKYNLFYIVIGFILSGFGVGSLVYTRSVRWLLARFGESGLILMGGSFACVSYLVIALLEIWWLFIPLIVLMGLGYYMLHSTLQTKATELAPGARGTAVSLFAFALFVGQGIGAAALGFVVDNFDYVPAFIIAGLAMLLLALWLFFSIRRYPQPGPNRPRPETDPAHSIAD